MSWHRDRSGPTSRRSLHRTRRRHDQKLQRLRRDAGKCAKLVSFSTRAPPASNHFWIRPWLSSCDSTPISSLSQLAPVFICDPRQNRACEVVRRHEGFSNKILITKEFLWIIRTSGRLRVFCATLARKAPLEAVGRALLHCLEGVFG